MKRKLWIPGVVAVASPLPMLVNTLLWFWFLFLGVGIYILGYTTVPDWILYLGLLPLSFSPLFDIFGIVFGFVHIRQRHAVLCILLSVLGLAINFLLILAMSYLGRY